MSEGWHKDATEQRATATSFEFGLMGSGLNSLAIARPQKAAVAVAVTWAGGYTGTRLQFKVDDAGGIYKSLT